MPSAPAQTPTSSGLLPSWDEGPAKQAIFDCVRATIDRSGARLKMLLLHDDATREYAYGPAQGLPDTQGGHVHARALRRGEEERLDGY